VSPHARGVARRIESLERPLPVPDRPAGPLFSAVLAHAVSSPPRKKPHLVRDPPGRSMASRLAGEEIEPVGAENDDTALISAFAVS
jgi:hypothetical protein